MNPLLFGLQLNARTHTVWYTGFVCLDVRLVAGRCQNTTCYTFLGLYKTGHHNNHHPVRQQHKTDEYTICILKNQH